MEQPQSENTENTSDNTIGARQMIGFRGSAQLRHLLTMLAKRKQMTLARYIEDLLTKHSLQSDVFIPPNVNPVVDLPAQRKIEDLKNELHELKCKYDMAIEKMEVFHHPRLLELFNYTKGKVWGYTNDAGRKVALRIEHPADVITILVHLFKPNA